MLTEDDSEVWKRVVFLLDRIQVLVEAQSQVPA
jgi:hypothetical protein